MTRPEKLDARASGAALAAVLVRDRARELDLVHQWLDSWSGIGLIVVDMAHQGFTVSLGEHGVGRWIAVFFHGRGGHEPIAEAGHGPGADAVAGGAEGGVGSIVGWIDGTLRSASLALRLDCGVLLRRPEGA